MAEFNFSEDAMKIAELTSNAIKAANDDTARQIEELSKGAEVTAINILKSAEEMVAKVKAALNETSVRLNKSLEDISEDMAVRSAELAERTDAFIRHCAESGTQLSNHHAKLIGTPQMPASPRIVARSNGAGKPSPEALERNIDESLEQLRAEIPRIRDAGVH